MAVVLNVQLELMSVVRLIFTAVYFIFNLNICLRMENHSLVNLMSLPQRNS